MINFLGSTQAQHIGEEEEEEAEEEEEGLPQLSKQPSGLNKALHVCSGKPGAHRAVRLI